MHTHTHTLLYVKHITMYVCVCLCACDVEICIMKHVEMEKCIIIYYIIKLHYISSMLYFIKYID